MGPSSKENGTLTREPIVPAGVPEPRGVPVRIGVQVAEEFEWGSRYCRCRSNSVDPAGSEGQSTTEQTVAGMVRRRGKLSLGYQLPRNQGRERRDPWREAGEKAGEEKEETEEEERPSEETPSVVAVRVRSKSVPVEEEEAWQVWVWPLGSQSWKRENLGEEAGSWSLMYERVTLEEEMVAAGEVERGRRGVSGGRHSNGKEEDIERRRWRWSYKIIESPSIGSSFPRNSSSAELRTSIFGWNIILVPYERGGGGGGGGW